MKVNEYLVRRLSLSLFIKSILHVGNRILNLGMFEDKCSLLIITTRKKISIRIAKGICYVVLTITIKIGKQ